MAPSSPQQRQQSREPTIISVPDGKFTTIRVQKTSAATNKKSKRGHWRRELGEIKQRLQRLEQYIAEHIRLPRENSEQPDEDGEGADTDEVSDEEDVGSSLVPESDAKAGVAAGPDADSTAADILGELEGLRSTIEMHERTIHESKMQSQEQTRRLEIYQQAGERDQKAIYDLMAEIRMLRGERSIEESAKIQRQWSGLFHSISNWAAILSRQYPDGIIKGPHRQKPRGMAWLTDCVPNWFRSNDKVYQKYTFVAIIGFTIVKHHLEFGALGSDLCIRERGGAQQLKVFQNPQNGHLYTSLIMAVDAARRAQDPQYEENLKKKRTLDLQAKIQGVLVNLTVIDKRKYAATTKSIIQEAIHLSELMHVSPATYRLTPFKDKFDDCERSKVYDKHLHEDLSEAKEMTSEKFHATVFPGLVKEYDELGQLVQQVLCKTQVLIDGPEEPVFRKKNGTRV
ncbi:Hypothetical protein D9617_3g017820 [Elsinoe fawcettii]|nr:Hypothetical protein D9617_3g017820 [Elsinoe fawcettii]